MKKRVLYFTPIEYDNTAFYRVAPLNYLQSAEYDVINGSHILDWNWSSFVNIDVFFIHRPCTQDHCNMMNLAKDMGVKVIIDYDDNLFEVDQFNPTHRFYIDCRLDILKALRIADEVWVTTQGVYDAYRKFNPNCIIIPNAHNDYLLKDKRPFNPDTKHIMWRGGQTHEADMYEHADELVSMINKHTDWTFNFFGHCFTYMELRCGNNYIRTPMMQTIQYFKAIEDYNANIMIVPLIDNAFNGAKSNIAWIEGSYAGASVFANKKMPEFDRDWIADFNQFLSEPIDTWNDLKYMNERSWQYITDNLLLSKVNQLRHERILANL